MTQLTNPTTPAISVTLPGGGSNIRGIAGDNRLTGGPQADIILTFDGNDIINAGAGNDLVLSGKGNDVIGAGPGNDIVAAGKGNDIVSGGDGDDLLFGNQGNDLLDGGAGNDTVSGDQGNDTVLGGAGNDMVYGGAGNDIVSGGDGNDSVYGGQGNDTVDGGAGNDFISGDRGSDVLTGGAGSDTFYFASAGGDFGVDTITDFTPVEDKIRLKSGGAFAALGTTFDASEFVVVSGFTPATPTAATANKLVYDPTSGVLYFNQGSSVLTVAQLTPGLTITASNFELF
ncbi:calcium-binding protein [Microcoleus sp.]|uniref:calcium-binding protein n=1 Tax=Microcoleus sp. TaxID=44472 RepID=UPI003523D122